MRGEYYFNTWINLFMIDQEANNLYMRCIPRGFESQVVLSKDAMISLTEWNHVTIFWQSFFVRRAISRCYQCHHIIWNKTSNGTNLVWSSRIACYGLQITLCACPVILGIPHCQWRHIDKLITEVLRSQMHIDQSQPVLNLSLGFDPWWWRAS